MLGHLKIKAFPDKITGYLVRCEFDHCSEMSPEKDCGVKLCFNILSRSHLKSQVLVGNSNEYVILWSAFWLVVGRVMWMVGRMVIGDWVTKNGDLNNDIAEHHSKPKHTVVWDSAKCLAHWNTLESRYANLEHTTSNHRQPLYVPYKQ